MSSDRFWTERSVPGSASWPFFRGRALSRYQFAFPFARGKRILDVASGTGHGSHLLATVGGAAEVVGVDVSREATEFAGTHYAAPNVRYVHGDSHRLVELNLGRFDLVTSMGTLEHIENPDRFGSGVRSLLNPGGVWLVTMLNPATRDSADPYHFQEWPADDFRTYLERYFPNPEIRWHVILPPGRAKMARTSSRYAFLPDWFKRGVKRVIGRQASLRISRAGADFCEPTDFEWSVLRNDDALEFLGVCRLP